jgi:signal transduction histidine kinase
MLRAVVADAFDALGATPAAVALDNEVEEGFALIADEDHLFRILMNLARNAVDALAGASEDQPGRVRVSARRTRDRIEIEVSDNGPGVSAAARERLFGAFTGSTRAGGVGLGLAIAADLVRAHGGEIELATAGEGATFRLVLPDRPV